MMRTLAVLAVAASLAACRTVEKVPAPGASSADYGPMTQLVETPSSRVERDIPESQRIAWYEAQRPKAAPVQRPVEVEREYVVRREYEPVRYVERPYVYDGWYLPFSLSLGWWGGRHGGHRSGWGWGLGWHSGWGWGW